MALRLKRINAPLHGWEARRALRAARRSADAELLVTRLPPPRLAWRRDELVVDKHRLLLGRALTDVVHASDERFLPGASPLDRGAVRECRAQLLELASRLCDLDRPVMPQGCAARRTAAGRHERAALQPGRDAAALARADTDTPSARARGAEWRSELRTPPSTPHARPRARAREAPARWARDGHGAARRHPAARSGWLCRFLRRIRCRRSRMRPRLRSSC